MQLIKGGGCHGGVIWLTHNVRQSKAQVAFSYYEFITCPCMNPCSVSGCSTHVFSVLRCVLFVPSWFVSRWVRTPKHSYVMLKCKSVLWNHGCGICYHQVSGSRFGSLRARCAFHWSSVCRRMSSTDMSFFWEQLIADVIIDVRVDVSVSSVVGLCCNEWQYVYDQCQCGPWC